MYPELFVSIAVFFFLLDAHTCRQPNPRSVATIDARTLHSAAALYAVDHPNEPCPTMQTLIDDGEIDRSSKRTDPWNRPYRIECTDEDVSVRSDGPDGKAGTADDIVIPQVR